MVVMEIPIDNPDIGLDPTFHFFLKRSKSESEVTISNEGTGAMEWEIGEIEYRNRRDEGWITVEEPASGRIEEGKDATVKITVDREGLRPGFYIAVVPVVASNNEENLIVIMRVPLFKGLNR
jgi:hypothetical protein